MLTHTAERFQPVGRTHALRTVIVVGQPGQQLPDSAFDAVDYDVAVLEPLAHAYSQIKRVKPALVIMCLSLDDLEGCHLLSMLKLDRETASIPIRTFATVEAEEPTEETPERDESQPFATVPMSMN